MTSKPFTVYGEALESESEEEIDSTAILQTQFKQCQGKIVSGEAPESDDETEHYKDIENINTTTVTLPFPSQQKSSRKPKSILVKKLCERNASLHRNLNNFISAVGVDAGNELNATNQRLLECQQQMQEGLQRLKCLNSNLKLLDLESILNTEHIPIISTEILQS